MSFLRHDTTSKIAGDSPAGQYFYKLRERERKRVNKHMDALLKDWKFKEAENFVKRNIEFLSYYETMTAFDFWLYAVTTYKYNRH